MATRQIFILLVLITAIPLESGADKGKDAFNHGVRQEHAGDLDAAFGYYKEAYTLSPSNAKYFASYTRVRFNAATQHLRNGQSLRNTGDLAGALAEFQHAVAIDTSSFIAQQELRRTADLIRRHERQETQPKVESPLAALAEQTEPSVELQPLSNAAINVRVTANADIAYKTICKVAGLNLLIDPDYRPQKITLDLTDVTVREALDMVRLQSKTYWRAVLPNTIFVTNDSPAKRKELEQNVMKTFYLKNIETPNELQEAANLVRQILDVTHVQLLQAQDALILRGTPDQMILAEKVLTDYDRPRSEVVIDIIVMQVSRDRIRNLGNAVPTSFSIGVTPPASSTNGGSSGAFTLKQLAGLTSDSLLVSLPGSSFTMLASDSNTKILQSPEIRALNNEKATLRIGDRVPIATGSYQPGIVGGGSVSPLVSTQFTYLDVGVNVDITPHIHSDNQITLKMALEISSVTGQQNIGGITQPIIGQRRIEHEARLADGEVNLLGGILEDTETQSLSGYPWVSKLPLLKYLFAQDNKERTEDEIVFAITPHIVRSQEITDDNLRMVSIGTGSSIELRAKQKELPAANNTVLASASGTQPTAAAATTTTAPRTNTSPANTANGSARQRPLQ